MQDEQPQSIENEKDENINDENVAPEENEITKELELHKQKAAEYLDGWKRAKADYINFKKDIEKSRQETIQYANAALLAELLPIYDNLKMGCDHIPQEVAKESWAAGFFHIKNQFTEFFRSLGIEEIKTVGEPFNPELHEALDWQEKEGYASDVIYEEAKPGYTLNGKVIVPAKVKVAK